MSIIAMSPDMLFGGFYIGQQRFDTEERSDSGGHSSARLLQPPRWKLSISSPNQAGLSAETASIWQETILRLRGRVNHFAAWDYGKPEPRGTMRGAMTLSSAAAAGATTAAITAGAGEADKTLLKGDWLQFGNGLGSQLVMLVADSTSNGSGVITVTFEAPLRVTFASGTAVTWDKPVAHYRAINPAPQWGWKPGSLTLINFSLDLLEDWTT